jgi:hypothetical protein
LGWFDRGVGVRVVDADQIEVRSSRVFIGTNQLAGVNVVPPTLGWCGYVLSRGGAVHTPRVRVQANQETATFLWVSASCVVDGVLKLIARNDYYQFLN